MEAEKLVRTRGFAGFSYADLSERVGIQKASIHHHFPTKEALGGVLIDSYLIKFEEALQNVLDSEPRADQRLTSYMGFFVGSMQDGMLPPTINLDTPDDGCDLDYVPNVAREKPLRATMSNSFGFGGHNSSLIFTPFQG